MDSILSYQRSSDDDYYKILGCDELSNTEQILTEYKARVLSCHPDKHPDDPTAAARFEKLQRAKDTLADPALRARYDQWMRSGIAMSFETWKGLRDSTHVSMHWAGRKPQPALQETATADQQTSTQSASSSGGSRIFAYSQPAPHTARQSDAARGSKVVWERDPASSHLQKFRDYQI